LSSHQGSPEDETESMMGRAASGLGWEYLTVPETERFQLPRLGEDGWELVAIGGDSDGRLLYFKRPVQSLSARVTTEQRDRYYASRGLDPKRSPDPDAL
jgi:hypothetical protein